MRNLLLSCITEIRCHLGKESDPSFVSGLFIFDMSTRIKRILRDEYKRKLSGINPLPIILIATLFYVSCSNLKYLDENQNLYTGSQVKVSSQEKINNKNEIEIVMESVITPRPNSKILIWRPRLWFYNIAGTTRERGIGNWIKNKLGRPPVLYEEENTERTVRLMQNRLFNMGHFDAEVNYRIRESNKRTFVEYLVDVKSPYTIRNIEMSLKDTPVSKDIEQSMEESSLQSGQEYRLDMLKSERERIDKYLKGIGYFYFHPDYLIFMADSMAGNREVDISLGIKASALSIAFEQYVINNIYIDIDQGTESFQEYRSTGRVKIKEGVYLNPGEYLLKPKTLIQAIFFEKDQIYTNSDHRLTINHLMGLGVFKFVNITFERVESDEGNYLDTRILLTSMEKKSISSEFRWVSKSNSFTGPGLSGSFGNRNFIGGAENFAVNLEGSFESLLGQRGVMSTEVGLSTELNIPRLITPYKIGSTSPEFIPKTRMAISFNHRNRTDAFSLSSLRSQFGYIWNPSTSKQHRLNPFVFNVFGLGTISDEFEQIFSREALLRKGLFEQFLIGSEYSFLYNSQLAESRNSDLYINLNIDMSGNLAWLISNYLGQAKTEDNTDYRVFNQSFSQYGKTDIDIRYYINIGRNSRLATRFIAGIGLPYGNSTSLPYTKLFTIGGSNSIRAFQPRTLGPGSYSPPDTLVTTLNIYQSGEIKLEMNIEYRFTITNIIKAAVFADAGNIWNHKEKEYAKGGEFKVPGFISQIALGTGAGLRLDFTFFLLRLDLAFPLAVPGHSGANSRYIDRIDLFDRDWRRDNLILNLAIGYPF